MEKQSDAVMDKDDSPSCVLYVFPFSLYSIMVRFTAMLGSTKGASQPGPKIDLRLVNLHRNEHVLEDYLININPKGQVPCMIPPSSKPLTESLDISYWFCDAYPGLLPEAHRETIRSLLDDLYSFHALPLSLTDKQRPKEGVEEKSSATEILEKEGDISARYREALEWKEQYDRVHYGRILDRASTLKTEELARDFLVKVLHQYKEHGAGGTWIFGDEVGPTVLDGHTVPFLARLLDMKRSDLIPKEVEEYGKKVMSLAEWNAVTHGRPTHWNVSFGHVADLKPL